MKDYLKKLKFHHPFFKKLPYIVIGITLFNMQWGFFHYLAHINSDDLLAFFIAGDILHGTAKGFILAPSPSLFPDIFLMLVIRLFTSVPIIACAIFFYIQASLFIILSVLLLKKLKLFQWSTYALFLGSWSLLPIAWPWIGYPFYVPAIHFFLIPVDLMLMLFFFSNPSRTQNIFVFIFAFLLGFSNKLFFSFSIAPFFFLYGLNLLKKIMLTRSQKQMIFSLTVGAFLGLFLYEAHTYFLGFGLARHGHPLYCQSPKEFFKKLFLFVRDLIFKTGLRTQMIIYIIPSLWILKKSFKQASSFQKIFSWKLAASIVCPILVTLGTCYYVDSRTNRYFLIFFSSALLGFSFLLLQKHKKLIYSLLLLLSLQQICFATYYAFTTKPSFQANALIKEIPCIRKKIQQYHVQVGLSDYWNAKWTQAFTKITMLQATGDLNPYFWATNILWYQHLPKSVQLVFPERLSREKILEKLGTPKRKLFCLQKEMWIYDAAQTQKFTKTFSKQSQEEFRTLFIKK